KKCLILLEQKSRSGAVCAVPPKADIRQGNRDVRYVPIADIGCHQLTWLLRRGQSANLEVRGLATTGSARSTGSKFSIRYMLPLGPVTPKLYGLDVEGSAPHKVPNDWSIASPSDR